MASMKAASRQRERGAYPTQPSHAQSPSQSSMDDHHVTDTFSDLYGDMDDGPSYDDSRLRDYRMSMHKYGVPPNVGAGGGLGSGASSSSNSGTTTPTTTGSSSLNPATPPSNRNRNSMARLGTDGNTPMSPGSPTIKAPPNSPSLSDAANASFPLNDIDYESNPAAVAQELSNLQALRRMSMDVNSPGNDPDLPAFNFIPSVAPKGGSSSDTNDASRLFWVPARLHPELAPKEFKSFVESRVQQIRHHEGEGLSPDGVSSGPSLRRKKSILSRQIDNTGGKAAEGYEDGAEILSRQRSNSSQDVNLKVSDIQEVLSQDPSNMMKTLSLSRTEAALTGEPSPEEDLPIFPAAPPGQALRRSTRTALRRGSLRKGERVPPSRRGARPSTGDDESPLSSPMEKEFRLNRVRTEPIPQISISDEGEQVLSKRMITEQISLGEGAHHRKTSSKDGLKSPSAMSATTSSPPQSPNSERAVTPPDTSQGQPARPDYISFSKPTPRSPEQIAQAKAAAEQQQQQQQAAIPSRKGLPERGSSREASAIIQQQQQLQPQQAAAGPPSPGAAEGQKRPQLKRTSPLPSSDSVQRLEERPDSGRSRRKSSESAISTSGSLSVRDKDKDKDGSRKPSWGWLLGSSDGKGKEDEKDGKGKKIRRVKSAEKTGEKEKEKERDREKPPKGAEKDKEHARLDLLQKSIDSTGVRESLDSTKERPSMDALEREREKEKEKAKGKAAGAEPKKEGGLLSSIFGGSKKKSSESGSKTKEKPEKSEKASATSPEKEEKQQANQQPYYYTRFPIHIERAIYRLSHLKLANPRRPLQQQVLLSNFMYAYLAKVQMMQPQNQQLQQAAQQREKQQQLKRSEEEARRQQRQQKRERQQQEEEEEARRRAEEEQYRLEQQQQQQANGNHVDQSDEDYDFDDDGTEGYGHTPDSPHRSYSRASREHQQQQQQQQGYYAGNGNGYDQQQQNQQQQQQQGYDYGNGYYEENNGQQQQQYYYNERSNSRGGGGEYDDQQQQQYDRQQAEYYRSQQGQRRGRRQEEEYDDEMW